MAAIIASAAPVLPLVASTIVPPGFSMPRASASRIMLSATRSLMAAARVQELALDVDVGREPLGHSVQLDDGRVTHRLGDITQGASHHGETS